MLHSDDGLRRLIYRSSGKTYFKVQEHRKYDFMEKTLKKPAAASLWYTLSLILARGAGLLSTPIFTRLLGTREYGLYTLYTSWLGIFTIISTLEIGGSVFMRELQKNAKARDTTLRSAIAAETGICAVICLLYFVFSAFFGNFLGLSRALTFMMFLQIASNATVNLYLAGCKFEYRYKTVFFLNVIVGVLPTVASLIMIWLIEDAALTRIFASLVITVLTALAITFIIFSGKKSVSFSVIRELVRRALPLFPHFLLISVISRIDKLVIDRVFGKSALGAYSVAEMLGSLLPFALGALFSALIPWIMRKISAGKEDKILDITQLITRLLSFCALLILCLSPELFGILAPSEFRDAYFAVFPITVSVIPYFIFTVEMTAITHGSIGALASLPSVCGAAFSFLFCIGLSGRMHYSVLSVAQAVSQLIMCALAYFIIRRRGRTPCVSLGYTVICFSFTAFVGTAIYLSRDFLSLRLAIAALSAYPLFYDIRGAALRLREAA